MLTVYTYPIPKPSDCFDLSGLPLDELCESALSIFEHQKDATIWLGYLDGWMLSPIEAVRLRKPLRAFHCIVVSKHPMSFSHSWKNEIDWIYTIPGNGDPRVNNNDSSI